MNNYYILKRFCKQIYFVGSGNFWYEDGVIGDDNNIFYKVFNRALFLTYGFMTVMEILAALIGDFPEDEKRDSITFALSHTIVMIKILSVISNKKLLKKLIHDLIKVCEFYEEDSLIVKKYRSIKINVVLYIFIVYGCTACYVYEGIRKMYDGSHFVTIVTYYPSFEDNSLLAKITRISTTAVLIIMMLSMIITVDCFALSNLIIFKYKFITLKDYFENLREEFDKLLISKIGNPGIVAEQMTRRLIEGIVMHKELIRISKEFDKAFGTILALQLCQTSGSAVSLLLQITLLDDLTFVAKMKISIFIFAVFFLLGLFLCNAGEITYRASLLSDSIFYCGWHLCPTQNQRKARRNLGMVVLQACAQAQRPIVMKAFKMIELTYGTFLLVVRSTYSVFALIYAQNQ